MTDSNTFEVIIVGGSYAGLSAGLALGRASRKVLIIDEGKPCNRQTPYSHNFLTNDGKMPTEIAAIAHLQIRRYDSVQFVHHQAVNGYRTVKGFEIEVASGERFTAGKLIFATGIRDILEDMDGLAACWGISVLHCPYCHGYEVRYEKTGIVGNGDVAFDFTKLISNWTKEIILYTNGPSAFTDLQRKKLRQHHIDVVEKEIERLEHNDGHLRHVVFKDGSKSVLKTLYAPSPFEQHCKIPEQLGCELTEAGYIKIDGFQETTVEGIYAIGDNASKMRTIANAVAMGTAVGMTVSKQMIVEKF